MSFVSLIPEYPWVAHKDKSTEAQGLQGMFEKKINKKNVCYLLVPQNFSLTGVSCESFIGG